jgi:putative DNA primase/helicase
MTNIPQELKAHPNWVVWRTEERDGKPTKVPYHPDGYKASSTDPGTWSTFDEADVASIAYDGLGFVFTGTPFAGVDLDHVLDGDNLDPQAAEIVTVLSSYTERSPGGDGLHIIIKGELPEGRRRKGNVEMYDAGRYFTMTGDHWPTTPTTIEERGAQLAMVHRAVFSENGGGPQPAPRPSEPLDMSDRDLIERAMAAENGDKFRRLWRGDTSAYPSPSEADLALCGLLAFWTQGDESRIERLFRQSGLMRDKWGRDDYRRRTISKAMESTEYYDPQGRVEARSRQEPDESPDVEPQVTPQELLDEAEAIDNPVERAKVLGRFCDAIAGMPSIEKDGWIEAAKARGLANKTTLRKQIEEIADSNDAPGQRELRDRWLGDNPNVVNTVRWRRYQDGWWPIIEKDSVKRTVTRIIEAAEADGVDLTSYLVNQVFDLVQIETFVSPDRWDADTSILVCANGTLELDSLELREHSREDYATGAVPYAYDPEADCPTFRYVVAQAAGDAAAFLQEFAGYALTTDTHLETAVWLKGERGGGKSTIIEGLQAMLGERCGTLGIAQIERSRFGLSSIVGKTLVVASDQPGSYISASNILNNVISGEKVKVEAKFQDPVDIRPCAKIVWSMNNLPRIKEGNNGIFRRVKVIEVPALPKSDRDPAVKELVKAEGPGILNWALEGLRRLRERGRFELSNDVQRATDRFQLENDKPRMFAEEMLVFAEDHKVKASQLYAAYRQWCIENGYQPRARQKLSSEWKRLGLRHKAERDANYYYGAGLVAD